MITLYFTKQFTGGILKGLLYNESMHFDSYESAAQWLKFARKGCRKPYDRSSPYKVVDASYQKYWRY